MSTMPITAADISRWRADLNLDPDSPLNPLCQFSEILTSTDSSFSDTFSQLSLQPENSQSSQSASSSFTPDAIPISSLSTESQPTAEALFALRKQAFDARDKEMQTKDGRAKWEAYEKRHNCVGLWEAQKKLAVKRACEERVDFEEMLRVHEERLKAEAEAGAAKKVVGKGKKGKK